MNTFLNRVKNYFFLFGVLIILVCLGNYQLFDLNHRKDYKKDYKTLMLGDSHFRYLNEKVIPNSINLFQDGDTYPVMYFKLLEISKYQKLDDLFLAYAAQNISFLPDTRITSSFETPKRSYAIAPISELIRLKNYRNTTKVLFKNLFSINNYYLLEALGINLYRYNKFDTETRYKTNEKYVKPPIKKYWFKTEEGRKVSIDKMISHQFEYKEHSNTMERHSIIYLRKILTFCKEKGISIHLINMPQDPLYRKAIPNYFSTEYRNILDKLIVEYEINFIDYSNEFDKDLELFKDHSHVTAYGGVVISDKLSQLVKNR